MPGSGLVPLNKLFLDRQRRFQRKLCDHYGPALRSRVLKHIVNRFFPLFRAGQYGTVLLEEIERRIWRWRR